MFLLTKGVKLNGREFWTISNIIICIIYHLIYKNNKIIEILLINKTLIRITFEIIKR